MHHFASVDCLRQSAELRVWFWPSALENKKKNKRALGIPKGSIGIIIASYKRVLSSGFYKGCSKRDIGIW